MKIKRGKKYFSRLTGNTRAAVIALVCGVVLLSATVALAEAIKGASAGSTYIYTGVEDASSITMDSSFVTSGNPSDCAVASTNTVSIGYANSTSVTGTWKYQSGAVTSKFAVDWTRPFTLTGSMTTPLASNSSDGVRGADQSMMGFHLDEGRTVKNTGAAAGYTNTTGGGTSGKAQDATLANSVSWYFNHHLNSTNNPGTGVYANTYDIGWMYWDAQGQPYYWDISFGSGISAATAWSSAALRGGTDNSASLDGNSHDFMIRWEIESGTTGTLTFSYNGYSKSVSGVDASTLFGSKENAQNTYFEMSTSLYMQPTYRKNFSVSVSDFSYDDFDVSVNQSDGASTQTEVSYTFERNGKTITYNPYDLSTWPVAGEKVHVTFTLRNKETQLEDFAVPVRIASSVVTDGTTETVRDTSFEQSTLKVNGATPDTTNIFNGAADSSGSMYTVTATFAKDSPVATISYDTLIDAVWTGQTLSDSLVAAAQGMTQTTITAKASVYSDNDATCKITKDDGVNYYYATLRDAVADADSGNTIEIFKSHTVQGAIQPKGKKLVIKNISEPDADFEDPTKNGSADVQPVVTFGGNLANMYVMSDDNSTPSNITLAGVIFDGAKDAGGRIFEGITVQENSSVLIEADNGGTGALKSETIIRNFATTSAYSSTIYGGGALRVFGSVVMNGGTISGCTAVTSGLTSGGGGAAYIARNGSFTLNGGTITGNGILGSSMGMSGAFSLAGGSFTMTGGTITGNYGAAGAAIGNGVATANDIASTITITGGEITNNQATFDGGAIFLGNKATSSCTLGGSTIIAGNSAGRGGSAIEVRANTTLTIQGSPVIMNNTVTGEQTGSALMGSAIDGISSNNYGTVAISGTPIITGNTYTPDGSERNLGALTAANISVGVMSSGALVGVYAPTLHSAGNQFATGTATATTLGKLDSFVNDFDKSVLGSAGATTKVVWPSAASYVCKVVETRTVAGTELTVAHPFESIANAVLFAQTLEGQDAVIEMIVADWAGEPVAVTLDQGKATSLTLTTAASDATDGYPYAGTAGTPATIRPKGSFAGNFFTVPEGSVVTVKDLTFDGHSSSGAETKNLKCIANEGTLTLDGETTIQNFTLHTGSRYTKTGSALYNTGTCTLKGNSHIVNNIVYGTNVWTGGAIAVAGGSVTLAENTIVEKNSGYDGGGIVVLGGAALNIKENVSINNNYALNPAGGIYVYDTGGTIYMSGGSIHDNYSGKYGGGGIYLYKKGTLHMSAGSIYNNTAASGCVGGGVAAYNTTSSLYISGAAQIYDNTVGGSFNTSTMTATSGKTTNNAYFAQGTYLVVEGSLTDEAKVGITAAGTDLTGTSRMAAGGIFGRSVDANDNTIMATTYTGYEKTLFCDTNEDLVAVPRLKSTNDASIIWAYKETLKLTKTIPEAVVRDAWFTVELTNNGTGEIVRQAIKVAAGDTSGSATLELLSAYSYTVKDVESQASWRYENYEVSYTSNEATSGTYSASNGDGNLPGILTISQESGKMRELIMATKLAHASWDANNSSVVNTVE